MFDVLSMLENTVGAFENALSLVANRASNTSTAGYREPEYAFSTLFTQQFYGSSAVGNGIGNAQGMSAHNTGSGSQLLLMGHSMRQGDIRQGTQTDAFINGSGFFVTQSAQNQQRSLTRNGTFRINAAGYLVDQNGNRVQGHRLSLVQVNDGTGNFVDPTPAQGSNHYSVDQHQHANPGVLEDIRFDPSLGAGFAAGQVGIDANGYIYSGYGHLPTAPESVNPLVVEDANGNLVPMIRRDANGNPILDENDAEISIFGQARFQLAIGSVSNPSALAVVSNGNAFQTSLASGEINIVSNAAASNAASLGGNVVTGGAFEASNVEIGRLLVEGVQIQRSYNAVQSVLGIVAKFMSNFFSTVGKVAA